MNWTMRMKLTVKTAKIEGPRMDIIRLVNTAIDGLYLKLTDAYSAVNNAKLVVQNLGEYPSPYDKTQAIDKLNTANASVTELKNRIEEYQRMLNSAEWK